MRMAILHVSGPSAEQQTRVMHCTAGRPCVLRHFKGHGLANGNRLVVLPMTSYGCEWFRQFPGDPISTPGVPNMAVSLPAMDGGTTFSWGPDIMRAGGGTYLLCWCGSTSGAHHTLSPACPIPRPEKGDHYLASAGYLSIAGPNSGGLKLCSVGIECVIQNLPGNGLEGGDMVSIQKECGKASPAPSDWASGVSGFTGLAEHWIPGGWLLYGPALAKSVLESSGGPLRSSSQISRGVWGMPNNGISLPNPRSGFFSWGAPSQNAPGDYSLCWCAARSGCASPDDFKVLVSTIRFVGPTVLPSASQGRICVRNRQCEILNYTGTWPDTGGQVLIASGLCGSSTAALGAPRNGISVTAPDGNSFRFGSDPLITPAGKYRLCWCFKGFACTRPEEFASYAGILRVKAPFGPLRNFWCTMGQPCKIEDVIGEASGPGDSVMVMTVCGDGLGSEAFENRGISKETAPDGTWFKMPRAIFTGRFRVCWCAGETLCAGGTDFDHDLGELTVGGPDSSAVYTCYEWEPCTLSGLLGTALNDGDRLFAISASINCSMPQILDQKLAGWPQDGLSGPSTNRGTVFTWGPNQVRMPPGIYTLCWCGVSFAPGGICNATAPFDVPAGQIKIGTSKEFLFVTRKKDPTPRSSEFLYGLLLLAPLSLAACTLAFFGWKRVTTKNNKLEPVAPDPFPKKKAWASAEQDRSRLQNSVKQVEAQRRLVLGTMDSCAEDGRMLQLEMPDFSGQMNTGIGDLLKVLSDNAFEDMRHAIEDNPNGAPIPELQRHTLPTNNVQIADRPDTLSKVARDSSATARHGSVAGFMSRFRKAIGGRSERQTDFEVRSIQGSRAPPCSTQGFEEEESSRPPAGKRARPVFRIEEKEINGGMCPASPATLWKKDWDVEEDGPLPPGMDFKCNSDERRRDVMLKILDM